VVGVNVIPRPLYALKWPGSHCIGGWVGPRADLDKCEKYRLHRNWIPRPSTRSQSLYRLDYPVPYILVHMYVSYMNVQLHAFQNENTGFPCIIARETYKGIRYQTVRIPADCEVYNNVFLFLKLSLTDWWRNSEYRCRILLKCAKINRWSFGNSFLVPSKKLHATDDLSFDRYFRLAEGTLERSEAHGV
jgi:hypothetical protein